MRLLESGLNYAVVAEFLPALRKDGHFAPLSLTAARLMCDAEMDRRALADSLALHPRMGTMTFHGAWPQAEAECDAVVHTIQSLPLYSVNFITGAAAYLRLCSLGC